MRKPAFCIGENKGADQLRSNRAANQRLWFHYIDSTIPLLPKSEISNLLPPSLAVQHLVENLIDRFFHYEAYLFVTNYKALGSL